MKRIIFVSLLLTLISCQKMIMKGVVNHYANTFKLHACAKDGKEVVYLPMVHISKPEFYDKVKHKLDSLRAEGYTVFYESIEADKDTDSLEKDMAIRKLRKIVGFYPDYSNKEIFKSLQIKGFVLQTKKNTGIIDTIDTRADLSLNKLIALYEKEKGTVTLSDYDLKAPLKEKYKAGKINQANSNFLIDSLRNDHLVKMVSESKAKKIAVIYGALHRLPLFVKLEKQDSLWHPVSVTELRNRSLQAVTQ
jgi:hypothetical protein